MLQKAINVETTTAVFRLRQRLTKAQMFNRKDYIPFGEQKQPGNFEDEHTHAMGGKNQVWRAPGEKTAWFTFELSGSNTCMSTCSLQQRTQALAAFHDL